MDFITAVENTTVGIWVRESGSIWSYPMIIFLHSVGLSFVVGLNAAIDLRLLGMAPLVPIAPLKKLFPVMWIGFFVNAISGVALLMADASTMLIAPLFYGKMVLIALAVTTLVLIRRQAFVDTALAASPVTTWTKVLAVASLVLWTGAITAGRLTAYIGPAVALKGISH